MHGLRPRNSARAPSCDRDHRRGDSKKTTGNACKGENVLFDAPDPRKMASRPVAWIASTMDDGAAVTYPCQLKYALCRYVDGGWARKQGGNICSELDAPDPSIDMSWCSRLPSTLFTPLSLKSESETALIQPSHDNGTANRVCIVVNQ